MPPVNITLSTPLSFAWQNAKFWRDATGRTAIIRRFWTFVNRAKAKDCWLWGGEVATHGYGMFTALKAESGERKRRIRAHRLAWLISRGDIPTGLEVCHECDHPSCVNPDHLYLGTHHENLLDSVRKGRKKCWGLQKLDAERVSEVRRRYTSGGVTQRDLAREFGIARNTVSQIVNRKTWAHLPDVAASERKAS